MNIKFEHILLGTFATFVASACSAPSPDGAQEIGTGGDSADSQGETVAVQAEGLTAAHARHSASAARHALQGTANNCLDVYGEPESHEPDRVDNTTCNGTDAQEFYFYSDGTIRNVWGYCLDVLGDNTTQGTLDFTTCNGTAAQQWKQHGQRKVLGPAGKCLDVFANSPTPGTTVDLATCNGTGAQNWWIINAPSALQSVGTKCLDIINSNTSPGARLQIFECSSGPNSQTFTFTAAGEIRNAVGECLDVMYGSAAGGQVQVYTCNGTQSQRWIRQGRALRSVLNTNSITGMCLGTVNTFQADPAAAETSADHTPVGLVPCDGREDQMWIAPATFQQGGPSTLLVVTSDALASSFASFLAYKASDGVPSTLLTVS